MRQLLAQRGLYARSTRQRGQALVEYALALVIIVGVFMIINSSIKRGIGGMWTFMAKNVAAGCPGCEPPPQVR
jgi:Flp pilus assembly pilin Flp